MSDDGAGPVGRRDVLRATAAGGVLVGVGAGDGTAAGTGAGTVAANGSPTDRHVVGTSDEETAEKVRRMADRLHRDLDFGTVGRAVAGRFTERAREAFARSPKVRYVEADGRMQTVGQSVPWGVDRTDADRALADGVTGRGADVAIVDSGVDSDHSDLAANLGEGAAFVSCDDCDEPWDDDDGHGTLCAGVVAAVDDDGGVVGVAPEATLHAVRVVSGGVASFSDVAAGIAHVADRGWDVASVSLGGPYSSVAADAVRYAHEAGVLLVAAAGNGGPCTDCVLFPASHPDVVAVSATAPGDSLASFSSAGPEVDLAAPGQYVETTVPGGTGYASGTSVATPHVSGAGALLMARGLSNVEARRRLAETAEDVGLAATEAGNGLLDVEAAVAGTGGSESAAFGVDSRSATDVATTRARLNGELTGLGDATSVDCYVKYWQRGEKSATAAFVGRPTLTEPDTFALDVSGLSPDTTYVFAARGKASNGDWDRGARLEFATRAALDVDSAAATDVTASRATLNGDVTGLGDAASVDCYVKYWERGAKEATAAFAGRPTLTEPGPFSLDVSGLAPDTTYVFAARGKASNGDWDRGARLEFVTA